MCQEFCRQGGGVHPPGQTPPHPHSRQTANTADSTHPTGMHSCYRPQRTCDNGNVFTGVCDSVHGGGGSLPQCMLGCHNPPRDQAPPTDQTHTPPPDQAPPPREADARIRSMSGRYASYWNTFLFLYNFAQQFPMYAGVFALQSFQPTICRNPACANRSRFMLDVNKSKFVDFQKVRIQETQSELPRGSIPRRYVSTLPVLSSKCILDTNLSRRTLVFVNVALKKVSLRFM